MSETSTPRCDAAYENGLLALHRASGEGKFARQLERELAAEAKHAADCSRAAEGYCNDLSDCIREKVDIEQRITSLEQCLRAVRESIDRFIATDDLGTLTLAQDAIDRELPRCVHQPGASR